MKRMLVLALLLAPLSLFATEQTYTTKVQGNCGSCKKRIVASAESVEGVTKATWDKKTKVLTVTYDDATTTPDAIKDVVLKTGHDVETAKATDENYAKLPGCCRYRDTTHD